MPGYQHYSDLVEFTSSACIQSQNKNDSVVVFVSAAKVALLSEQKCILLLARILVKRISACLRIAITSAENAVDMLPTFIQRSPEGLSR
jgi:hypothetical protein